MFEIIYFIAHKIPGKNDFYDIYDIEKPEMIIEESDTVYQSYPGAYTIT